jgi:hypothetical protein
MEATKQARGSIGDHMKDIEKLLEKYEEIERKMLVMDDYDGGQAHMVRLMISDLKKLIWWTV